MSDVSYKKEKKNIPKCIPNGHRNELQFPRKRIRSRKLLSKAATTRIYADQLSPLYPALTKTQVKAALVLSNNNMHECRLVLDMKCKFLQLKKSFKSPKFGRIASKVEGDTTDSNSSIAVGTIVFGNDKKHCNDVGNGEMTSSSITTSFFGTTTSSSSVYDYSESESDIEPTKKWFEDKRNNCKGGNTISNEKVGVIIIKSQTGYKACPL